MSEYWFNTRTKQVEEGRQSDYTDLMGPYPTRAEAEAARAQDPRLAIALLRAAVDLWRGRFLEDIDHDRVGGTEVMGPDDAYLDVVGDLAELELDAGDHRSARDRLRHGR